MMEIHVVRRGDTLYSVARQYGVSPVILGQNNQVGNNILVAGQTLVVLHPRIVYTIRQGDTLYSIAKVYGVTLNQLWRNNIWLGGYDRIQAGQQLVIEYEETPRIPLSVMGYAYPHVQYAVLRQILPYAGILVPFTYGFTDRGTLVELNDLPLIGLAKEYGATPWMHLSSLTEEGRFSSEMASQLLNNLALQEVLIENLLINIQRRGYLGLDVDFEFIPAEDAMAYAAFLARLRSRLNPLGLPLLAALAPQEYPEQTGPLVDGHDYKAIGAATDKVLLMTYEWGYTYGPPMAVAPLPNVARVAKYAASQIPPQNIYLGIPNYGYDWPLPFVRGETKARSIGNQEAISIAARYGAEIHFDATSQAPWFNYRALDGTQHVVWFEDARSIKAKLELIEAMGFYGAGYWNFMRRFPQNWLVVNAMGRLIR